MATNLFNTGDDRTTISDSEKLAAGAGTSNAFNITWLAFKALLNAAGFFKSGDNIVAGSGDFSMDVLITKPVSGDIGGILRIQNPIDADIIHTSTAIEMMVGVATENGWQVRCMAQSSFGNNPDLIFSYQNGGAGFNEMLRLDQSSGLEVTGSVTATVDMNCVDMNYSGSLNDVSDQRVKDSIRDFTFNREAFKRLSVKRYNYKADDKNIDFINPMAQDLEMEFPWLVNHSKSKIVINDNIIDISTLSEDEKGNIEDEDRLRTIKSMQLSVMTTEGLRLEMIKNDRLNLRVETLESKLKNLTNKIDNL